MWKALVNSNWLLLINVAAIVLAKTEAMGENKYAEKYCEKSCTQFEMRQASRFQQISHSFYSKSKVTSYLKLSEMKLEIFNFLGFLLQIHLC